MSMENRTKHLEFIQAVVNRMANTSFLIKGWCVTLVAAVLALTVETSSATRTGAIAVVPIFVFWILDGYYLSRERRYRGLYDVVRVKPENSIDFSMDASGSGRGGWFKACFSATLIIFYGALGAMAGAAIAFIEQAAG